MNITKTQEWIYDRIEGEMNGYLHGAKGTVDRMLDILGLDEDSLEAEEVLNLLEEYEMEYGRSEEYELEDLVEVYVKEFFNFIR